MATKKLGKMSHPEITIERFSGPTGNVELKFKTNEKSLTVESGIGIVHDLVRLAQSLTGKQREYALSEWSTYLQLKQVSGYKNPADGNN